MTIDLTIDDARTLCAALDIKLKRDVARFRTAVLDGYGDADETEAEVFKTNHVYDLILDAIQANER